MKKLVFLSMGLFISSIVYGQILSLVTGDTSALTQHHYFTPAEHIERVGPGEPVEYNLDVNLDGFNDISVKCANSYGAMGYASNYLTVKANDSNEVYYAQVDSSYCFNGYKPVYFAKLCNISDTITNELTYSQKEMIINKELWFMNDTCSFNHENTGAKYFAVRLNSHGIRGLAWVSIELFPKNSNGFAADIKETGFKSITSSISGNFHPEILVYPNPSNGLLNIHIPEMNGNITATIFDLLGKKILVKELFTKMTTLSLANGTYILNIAGKHKELLMQKIIVL
ncbi:MAG: T9SS type A sorting domain-containing protein [Bacteroidota bacterium]